MTIHSYRQTGQALAAALMCQPRVEQTLTITGQTFGGGLPPRYDVLVVAAGAETGTKYRVLGQTLELLKLGQSPEYLELEPADLDEEEDVL